jgi:hypothetical protein
MIVLNVQSQQAVCAPQHMDVLLEVLRLAEIQMRLYALPADGGEVSLALVLRVRRAGHLALLHPAAGVAGEVVASVRLDGAGQLRHVGLELGHLVGGVVGAEEDGQQFGGQAAGLAERFAGRVWLQVCVLDAGDAVEDGLDFLGQGPVAVGGHEFLVAADGAPVDGQAQHGGVFFRDAIVEALSARLGEDGVHSLLPDALRIPFIDVGVGLELEEGDFCGRHGGVCSEGGKAN